MRFHFPVIIIDEDFRSENSSGLGIRVLAEALDKEGIEVLGVTRSLKKIDGDDTSPPAPAKPRR